MSPSEHPSDSKKGRNSIRLLTGESNGYKRESPFVLYQESVETV